MNVKNWILKKHIVNIEIISDSYMPFYKNYLIEKGVLINDDFSKSESIVNWNLYKKMYDFFYDYDDCEKEVGNLLLNSELIKSQNVIMDFGYNNPIVKIKTNYFINHWYEFINGAHFESVVISEEGKNILEFDKNGRVKSNFVIK